MAIFFGLAKKTNSNGETPMDRPRHQHHLPADPFAKPNRDRVLAETDPWGLGEAPELAAIANPTDESVPIGPDISPAEITRSNAAVNVIQAVARKSAPDASRRLPIVARVWARVQSRLPLDRRVVAGLGVFVVACVLLVAVSRYDFPQSSKTVSGTTDTSAVERLTSAFTAALNWIGLRGPVASQDVASISKTKVSNVRPRTRTPRPIDSLPALQLAPLVSTATNAPAPVGNADVDATMETSSEEAAALAQDDSSVETSIIYSPNDADVSPPVAIRSPGPATDRHNEDKNVSLIEILVSETGRVESVTVLPRPATLGAALQSTMALSVVKTWRFRPARKNGHPVRYRTTVPLVETVNAGRND